MVKTNDFTLTVATVNGSGSQSSNNILVRALFCMGLPVGGKNLFPSNIQGLPTWFTIRVNEQGFTARKKLVDCVVALNPQTAAQDLKQVRAGGYAFVSTEIKLPPQSVPADIQVIYVPFKDLVGSITDSVKLKKLLINMTYVGVLAELLQIPPEVLAAVVAQQFENKEAVIDSNRRAIEAGRQYATQHLQALNFPFRVQAISGGNDGKILIDGNTAAGMGLVFGGCTVVAWYPITPSSSLVEAFIELADEYRVDPTGKKNFAVLQAEDELASIAMVLGAGWTGARAMTATSGPGLSLMSEAAGLAYYAEIPGVIWDVQRVGPSTGLPTRTMQGDLLSAYHLSHGDTKHVVLLPGTPEECFEYGQTAFDLAERLQTLVIVLSDLDLGMNFHMACKFAYPRQVMDRGKILSADQLNQLNTFQRYKDVDGDGIPRRTLPGTEHPLAAYFTRGTGHDESGLYSENPEVYQANVDRLARKFQTAATLVPPPIIDVEAGLAVGVISYGSSHEAVAEVRHLLHQQGIKTNCLRLRALPLGKEVADFLKSHQRVYVVEQNRDAQLLNILRAELPQYWQTCVPILQYDGLTMEADGICAKILADRKEAI